MFFRDGGKQISESSENRSLYIYISLSLSHMGSEPYTSLRNMFKIIIISYK